MNKKEWKKKDTILTAITLSLLIFLIGFIKWTTAQIITIGVSPAKVYLQEKSRIMFKFYNSQGDTDAIYKIYFDECLEQLILSDSGCWDGETITVPKGTTIRNPITKTFCFDKPSTSEECHMIIEGKPKNFEEKGGTVNLNPRVGVKFVLEGSKNEEFEKKETSLETSSSSYRGGIMSAIIKQTTTTISEIPTTAVYSTPTVQTVKGEKDDKGNLANKDEDKYANERFPLEMGIGILLLLTILGVGIGILKTKKKQPKEIPKEGFKLIPIFLLLLIPQAFADTVNVSVDVQATTTTTTLPIGKLGEVGTGIGLLLDNMSPSLMTFMILVSIGTMVGLILTRIRIKEVD